MTTIETGGPAFPSLRELGDIATTDDGMALRDYLAAKVLPAVYADYCVSARQIGFNEKWKVDVAIDAYQMADAMLAARKPDPQKPQTAEIPPQITPAIPQDDVERDDALPPADASLLALANRELADRLARVAHVLRGSGLEGLKDLDDGADLQTAAAALTGAYQMALANLQARGDELFVQAGAVVELRTQLETLQREAMRGASCLSGQDRYTAAGYLVRASKRKPRTLLDKDKARDAALSSIRAGAQRAEVFALVPIGHARRGAEWRPA